MVFRIRSFFFGKKAHPASSSESRTTVADHDNARPERENPRIGDYWADYSQPQRAELDALENSCTGLFRQSTVISAHHES
jgi:hypothetical protein